MGYMSYIGQGFRRGHPPSPLPDPGPGDDGDEDEHEDERAQGTLLEKVTK